MFSGIVEGVEPVLRSSQKQDTLQIFVKRPPFFNDLKNGDSISLNGVCLTVENFNDAEIQFTLGQETLQVTGWTAESLQGSTVNLERSLRLGDRIHGHLVSGHVDTVAKTISIEKGESWNITFEIKKMDRKFIWAKGSVTLNGVSLTVNKIEDRHLTVCLIPETLLRTNLKDLHNGDIINVEYDLWAKAFVNYQEQRVQEAGLAL
jgi:riboflavin synthase